MEVRKVVWGGSLVDGSKYCKVDIVWYCRVEFFIEVILILMLFYCSINKFKKLGLEMGFSG